jgi:periplasmic copper chaperone A
MDFLTRRRSPIATPSSTPLRVQAQDHEENSMKFNVAGVAALLLTIATPAVSADIALDHPWARATPAGAQVGAGYMTIKSTGGADRLVSATADVANKVEIHEMSMTDGVMKMRQIQGLDIPTGKPVELKPGGYHIMFIGLKQPLKVGDTIKGALTFEKAGTTPVEYKVEPMGAGAGGMSGEHKH